jgi:acyl-CoA thioester hydrolase
MTSGSSYGRVEPVKIHFDELDGQGVLHHSRYAVLLDRAVIAYWMGRGWSLDPSRSVFDDTMLVVRELNITFHAPARGPAELAVHFWLSKMGRTSTVYGFRILSEDHSVLHADGSRVVIKLDPKTLRPAPFSDALREAGLPLMHGQDAPARQP